MAFYPPPGYLGPVPTSASGNVSITTAATATTLTMTKPSREACPHCGAWYDPYALLTLVGSGHILRFKVEDDADDDLYLETCMTELLQFMARNLHSRYTDASGNVKSKP